MTQGPAVPIPLASLGTGGDEHACENRIIAALETPTKGFEVYDCLTSKGWSQQRQCGRSGACAEPSEKQNLGLLGIPFVILGA